MGKEVPGPELLNLARCGVSTGIHRGPRPKPPSFTKATSTVSTPPWRPKQKEGQEGKGKKTGARLQGGHGETVLSLFFFFFGQNIYERKERGNEGEKL